MTQNVITLQGADMDGMAHTEVLQVAGSTSKKTGARHYLNIRRVRMALIGMYVMPMAVIAYLYMQYIFPMFSTGGQEQMALGISAVMTFSVVLSVLGLAALSKSANESVEGLRDLNDRMDSILSVTKRFEETGYVDTLVDSIARSSRDLLSAEASSLLLYDDNNDLRFEYVEGAASKFLKGRVVKIGEGITGWAAQENRPVIINDVQADPRFAVKFDKGSGFVTRSIICVPLVFDGRSLGIIEAINKKGEGGFTEQDQETLVSLAEHASASIYRNKTYDEMKSDFVHVQEVLVTAMDNHIPEKKGHARRVARYSVKLAKGLGLAEAEVKKVYFGALMHDIGFLRYDLLEYQDRDKCRLHTVLGAEIVKNISQWSDIAQIVRDHHERYDGSGYPSGLKSQDIALGGRIIAVAETFDVMTSAKSYKPAVSFNEAAEEIRSLAGYQFDPQVTEVFGRTFGRDDIADVGGA